MPSLLKSQKFRPFYGAVFTALCLVSAVGTAQEISAVLPWSSPNYKPTQLQTNQFLSGLLLCDMSGASISANSDAERDAVRNYIGERLLTSNTNNNAPPFVSFSALGVNFTTIFVGGGGDGAAASEGAFAWSATGTVDEVTQALRAHEIRLIAEKTDMGRGQLEAVLGSSKVTTDLKQQWIVAKGEIFVSKNAKMSGVTLACITSSPTDAEVHAATGLPSTNGILKKINAGEKIPKDVIDQVIQRGGPRAVEALAGYQWLDADQVVALLASKLPPARQRLLRNKNATLSAQHIDQIIQMDTQHDLLVLIASRYDVLNTSQREKLIQRSSTEPYMIMREGNRAAIDLLSKLIKDGDGGRFSSMLRYFPALNNEVVNLILQSGTPKMRSDLTMNSAFIYNAEQKETILQDTDRKVQIGLLRRKDVQLTDAQVARGINHPDKDLAFWYQQVKGYAPTAEQIEIGLTSTDARTRAGWAANHSIEITSLQAQRGLADTVGYIVAIFLNRADLVLTEANRDACTVHPEVTVRFACVKRADYTLTQKRFEQLATDRNANVLRFFLERKDVPAVDLNPFFEEALRNASESALLAMAVNSALPLTAEQLKRVPLALTSPKVEQAFARRNPAVSTGAKSQ
jgi:hypothetical protein